MQYGRVWAACALLAAGSAHADQLVLKNGDRVTGSIVKKDAKSITIKSDAFGAITAPWEQVESITADKPLTVVLKDGKRYVLCRAWSERRRRLQSRSFATKKWFVKLTFGTPRNGTGLMVCFAALHTPRA